MSMSMPMPTPMPTSMSIVYAHTYAPDLCLHASILVFSMFHNMVLCSTYLATRAPIIK